MLNREQQRNQQTNNKMAAIGLWCHLRNLKHEILSGDTSKLSEFQQFLQFAPREMKAELLEVVDG